MRRRERGHSLRSNLQQLARSSLCPRGRVQPIGHTDRFWARVTQKRCLLHSNPRGFGPQFGCPPPPCRS